MGDLAPDVAEAHLTTIFSTAAAVQSSRVCRDVFTRESLGYAYVNFMSPEDALKVMEEFNHAPINGRPCRIMLSQREPALRSNGGSLLIKNLDPELTNRDLHDAFKNFGTLLSVKVATNNEGQSKGYGFVHFDTEPAAKLAIEGINGVAMGKQVVKVEPYLPKAQRGTQDRWTSVFVKNLPKAWSNEKFAEAFAPFGEFTSLVLPSGEDGLPMGYGFVKFKDHEMAVAAVEAMHGKVLEGEEPIAPPLKEVEAAAAAAAAAEGAPAPVLTPRPPKLYVARFQRKADRQCAQKEKQESLKKERAMKFQGCNLYVRNLEDAMDDAALRKEFEPFGAIQSARVAMEDGRSKCFGFVCFSTPVEANAAREAMNCKPVGASQKPLHVVLWEPKDARLARQSQATIGGGQAGTPLMMQQMMMIPQLQRMMQSVPNLAAAMAAVLQQAQAGGVGPRGVGGMPGSPGQQRSLPGAGPGSMAGGSLPIEVAMASAAAVAGAPQVAQAGSVVGAPDCPAQQRSPREPPGPGASPPGAGERVSDEPVAGGVVEPRLGQGSGPAPPEVESGVELSDSEGGDTDEELDEKPRPPEQRELALDLIDEAEKESRGDFDNLSDGDAQSLASWGSLGELTGHMQRYSVFINALPGDVHSLLLARGAIDRFANRTGVQLSLRPHELAGIDAAVMVGLCEWELVQESRGGSSSGGGGTG